MELHEFYVTLDYILSITTQEKIFEAYLYPPDLKTSFTNPFRLDRRPGCSFYYKNRRLYFVDWAWGKKHYDCVSVVMEKYKIGYKAALEQIAIDVKRGYIKPISDVELTRIKQKNSGILRVRKRDYLPKELEFWNIGGLTITQENLEAAGIYAVETIWEQDWVIDNCFMVFAYVENGQVTQIYFPLNKNTGRRRFANSEGFTIGKKDNLPYISDHVVIGKAAKCSFYMDIFDITNLYRVNESDVIPEDVYEYLKLAYNKVFYLGDNDFAGKRLAVKYRQTYPDITILLFPKGEPKDFSDNLSAYGYQYMIDLKEEMYNKFVKE
jgi:hypothetical protein